MISADILVPFLLASIALDIAPGPDNLFVLTQSALHGKKAGALVTLGLCTGLIFHTSLVALGLAVIFQESWALGALKLFAATYLLYLAYKTLAANLVNLNESMKLPNAALYQRGIIMSSTNPKVSVFFLAFLPQFISADTGSFVSQVFILGGVFAVTAFCVFSGIAYAGGRLQQQLISSPNIQIMLNRVAACVFTALAANLLL